MCISFGHIPQLNVCHFFPPFELSHFSGLNTITVYRQWVPSPTGFADLFETMHMVWILLSDYVFHFFRILKLVIFQARILSNCIDNRHPLC